MLADDPLVDHIYSRSFQLDAMIIDCSSPYRLLVAVTSHIWEEDLHQEYAIRSYSTGCIAETLNLFLLGSQGEKGVENDVDQVKLPHYCNISKVSDRNRDIF